MIELSKKGESYNLVSANGNWFLRPDKTRTGEDIIYIWPDRPHEQTVSLMGWGRDHREAAGKIWEMIQLERAKLDRLEAALIEDFELAGYVQEQLTKENRT